MRSVWIAFAFSLLAAPVALHAEQLDVKTGQWEMTALVHLDGPIIPPEAMAHLPPEVRAQIAGALQTAQKPHTDRSCITQEKLRRGLNLDHATHGNCHQDMLNLSGRVMEMRGECETRDGTSTMHATITAVDRETLQGSIDVDRPGATAGPGHIRVELNGKWLGPECDGHEDHD